MVVSEFGVWGFGRGFRILYISCFLSCRFEMFYNIWCDGCKNYIGMGELFRRYVFYCSAGEIGVFRLGCGEGLVFERLAGCGRFIARS